MHEIEIEAHVLEEWQEISNLVSKLCDVPSALVIRQNEQALEVVVASEHADTPFLIKQTLPLIGKTYCERVIENQKPLHIPNTLKDSEWSQNPSIELGMIAYYGVPINWPDGSVFGTFCLLDNKESLRTEKDITLIQQFAHIIELTLELLLSKEQMYILSITDELTHIPNRRYFFDSLNKEFKRCRRHKTTFCVAMFDIDHFKSINDRYGHVKGDEVLISFAQQLKQIIREEDTLGRIGGEEFALVMPYTSLDEAQHIIERFKQHFDAFELPQVNEKITFSVGLAELNEHCETAESLLKQADSLLYKAKEMGRNQICV